MDNQSLEQFVRQYSRSQLQILGFIQMFVPSPTEAEEILQETSVVLWTKWSQYDSDRDFASWACGIARYEVFKHLRKRKHNVYLSEPLLQQICDVALCDTRSLAEDQAKQEALARCFQKHSPADQHLLNERYRDAKSVDEIAQQRSVTPRSIYKRLSLLREMLKRCIESTIHQAAL